MIRVQGAVVHFLDVNVAAVQLIPHIAFPDKTIIIRNGQSQLVLPEYAIGWDRVFLNSNDRWNDKLVLYDRGVYLEETHVTWSKDGGLEWRFLHMIHVDKPQHHT